MGQPVVRQALLVGPKLQHMAPRRARVRQGPHSSSCTFSERMEMSTDSHSLGLLLPKASSLRQRPVARTLRRVGGRSCGVRGQATARQGCEAAA